MDISALLSDAIDLARKAGAIQMEYFRGDKLDIKSKLNDSDVVTAADKAAESVIISGIHSKYPNHSILSEESGEEAHEADVRWVIDPLDGTTNFSSGLPLFSVSIGIEYQGETVVGVVYAPYLDELFHAIKGEGAYLNGIKIHTSGKTKLAQSVIATGFPVDKNVSADNNMDNVAMVLPYIRGLRRLGSAAIDLCYVAAGYLDGYWELNLHQWDVSAGELIAKESGAKVTHFRYDRNISILAATPNIHDAVLPMLSRKCNG